VYFEGILSDNVEILNSEFEVVEQVWLAYFDEFEVLEQ
jgi:hypothetical protein